MKENTFFDKSNKGMLSLDEIARIGAQQMLAVALKVEIDAYMESVAGIKDEDGHPVVVRNGHHKPRQVAVGSGMIQAVVPRTRTRDDSGLCFKSSIIPPYMRRSPKLATGDGALGFWAALSENQ